MADTMIAVRLTSEQKERLEQLASQRNQTVSDVIRNWIDGDSVMDGISPDVLERIRTEAARRKTTEANVIAQALRFAFTNLFIGVGSPLTRW